MITFILFALLFKPGTLFYEGKLYVQYLASFIKDFDLNILNQVPQSMTWLVSPTFYHPDQHPDSQIALMLPFYLLEFISKQLSFTQIPSFAFDFEYSLTTLGINIFCISLGFYFISEICRLLSIKINRFNLVIFTFGSALFYFSFLQSSVLEVAAFPLLSYIILVYFNVSANKFTNSPLICGICSSFLLISKLTFWPMTVALLLFLSYRYLKQKMWLNLIQLAIPIFLVSSANAINRFIKYGFYLYDLSPPLESFFDASIENISRNLLLGFFPNGGLFFANPIYFISVVGFLVWCKKLIANKKIDLIFLMIFVLWFALVFFGHIIITGYIVEDHLPGRIHLGFAPLLILGLIYLNSCIPEKYINLWRNSLLLCCFWHLLITFFYLVMIQGNSLVYANNMIPTLDLFNAHWPNYIQRVKDNASGVAAHKTQIVVFSMLFSLIFIYVAQHVNRDKMIRWFSVICLLCYITVTVFNIKFGRQNAEVLRHKELYSNAVIGKGAEIFYLDYVLQYVSTMKSRCVTPICEKLDSATERYYSKVKEQIIKSSPELDAAIAGNITDFSIWIDLEKNKKKENE